MGINYVVADSRHTHSSFRYHLNFCRPLHRLSLYKCPGNNVAACQINIHDNTGAGISLGTQYTPPTVFADGTISILYTNGSNCDNSSLKISTRINLHCTDIEGVLSFVGEFNCVYTFDMNTPFACPLQKHKGSECSVVDPAFGHRFDLTPLQDIIGNVSVGDYIYFVRVCKSLENVPDTCKGSGACQTKPSIPGFSKNLGLPNSDLIYDDGLLQLKYEGGTGNCHEKYNRTTTITFTCDHNATDTKPHFVVEAEECWYTFEWPTKYACPPSQVVDCSVTDDDGNIYDLSKLSLTNNNYYVDADTSTLHYVINVCRSVVYSSDSLCAYSSAACLFDVSNSDPLYRGINLGIATHSPVFENGKLKLKYITGDPCKTKGSSARFYETLIEFTCDKYNVNGRPKFIGKDECTYYFDWSTAYACSVHPTESSGNCTVQDPITGFLYNLSSLSRNAPYQVQQENHVFSLNVCDKVYNTSCSKDAGMCQHETDGKKRYWNAGKYNNNLQIDGDVLYLNYSGGDPCHGGKYQRNTFIQFRCGTNESLKPTYIYENAECSYYFTWVTKLACQFEVLCSLQNGTDHFDLSSLSHHGHALARSDVPRDEAVYFINVCGPLFNTHGIPCPQGSSICRVPHHSNVGEDIGSVIRSPFMGFDGHATAIYNNGSVCTYNPLEHNRARIIFICDPDEIPGEPVLIDITQEICLYIFEWRTNVVCPSKSTDVSVINACEYRDVGKGIYFNLESLRKNGSYYEVKEENKANESFLLNICGTVDSSNIAQCKGASVCYQNKNNVNFTDNYGLASSHRFTYDGQRLRLTLSQGDDCPHGENERRMSEIFFICDTSAGVGRPVLYKRYTCLVVFMWKTNLLCNNIQHPCMFDVDGNIFDLHLLSSITHNWKVNDAKNNTYYLNLCRGITQNNETFGCPPSSSVCMRNASESFMPLGMTYTVTASKQDDSTLLLTYDSQSHLPCSGIKLSADVNATVINATTRIYMSCGTTLGAPRLISPPDNRCYYNFVWNTSLLCPTKMEEAVLEANGILYDKKLKFGMDLGSILNKTYIVEGDHTNEQYKYLINLSGRYQNETGNMPECSKAAVCQVKEKNPPAYRDIGSVTTRKFYLRGSELHLELRSLTRPCGKLLMRNVTTVINMQCSTSAHHGVPKFLYESGGCDYVFTWETKAICPNFSLTYVQIDDDSASNLEHHSASSSHSASIVATLIILSCLAVLIFILSKAERRSAVASKFRGCCSRVSMPRFRYKRGDMLTELQSDF